MRQRGTHGDALALAAGKLGPTGLRAVAEAGGVEQLTHAPATGAGADAAQCQRQGDRVGHWKLRRDHIGRPLGQVADPCAADAGPTGLGQPPNVLTEDAGVAR